MHLRRSSVDSWACPEAFGSLRASRSRDSANAALVSPSAQATPISRSAAATDAKGIFAGLVLWHF